MTRQLAHPDDFVRMFEGRHPGFSTEASFQEVYIRRNDWPILVVVASSLGEFHAIVKHKMVSESTSKMKDLEKALAHLVHEKISRRLKLWGLSIPGENQLLDRLEVRLDRSELSTQVSLNVVLPWEFREIFERYRTLGHAMVKDHMNAHMHRLREEEKKQIASVQTQVTGTFTTYQSGVKIK